MTIKIKRSPTADSRTCDVSTVTKEMLEASTEQHIDDVQQGMKFFCQMLEYQAYEHDWSKLKHLDWFYRNFKTGFAERDWLTYHKKYERHHFNEPDLIQEDVNLIDVLEQIVDCVMASKARGGGYIEDRMPDGLLEKAYANTVKLLSDNVEVEE